MTAAVDPAYAGYIKNYYGDREALQSQFPEGEILYLTAQTAIVYLRLDSGGEPSIGRFGYNAIPKLFTEMDDGAATASGVTQLRQFPVLRLTGAGTLIAVLDSGIDIRSPAFRDMFGRSRILRLWDMTDEEGTPPSLFGFGSEYTQEQIDRFLFSDTGKGDPGADGSGHGTRIAGIAAGSELAEQQFTGMAPEAGLVIVKVKEAKPYLKAYYGVAEDVFCYGEDDLMIAARYAVWIAEELRMPLSVALGCGSGLGSHTGSSPLSIYLSRMGNSTGTSVCVPAGNEGNRGRHFYGSVVSGVPEEVQLRVGQGENGFTMELWGTIPNNYSVAIQSPSGEMIPVFSQGRNAEVPIYFLFEGTTVYVDYVLAEEESGLPLIQMRFRDPAPGIWSIRVYGGGSQGTIPFHIWLPAGGLIGEETYFLSPSPEVTITEPGNAVGVLTAAAYDDARSVLYPESGRGFSANDRVKPTLAAPGVDVLTPARGGFSEGSGTSLAAAASAGCAALILQWAVVMGRDPLITGVLVRNYLIRGARRKEVISYPNRQWGYGELDVYRAFLSLRGDVFPIFTGDGI